MITLEEIIISRGDIEKIYRAQVTLTLWRALNRDDMGKVKNPLYPDFEARKLPNGDVRSPDIKPFKHANGQIYVKAEEGVGTSLVDRDMVFGNKSWEYVVIPAGTVIPNDLIITKDHYMPRKKCWYYSISPNFDMQKNRFTKALDMLATNAEIKLRSLNAKYK
jgi:hypothetical protein